MKLILNGDDFGITKACNYAIIDCFKDGVLTSTSMMTNMPGAKHAAMLMKEYSDLSVGIHLNLTVGKPLTNCPTLLKEDGTFNKGMLKNSENVSQNEIRQELQAQIDRFIELTGKIPDHLNSHHGIEVIKGAEKVVCELANKYQLPVRRFFTLPEGNHPDLPYEVPKINGFVQKDHPYNLDTDLISYYTKEDLESDAIYEYAAHPGYVDYEILQFSSLTTGRAYDAQVFLSNKVKQWIKSNHIELVNYKVLKKL